MQKEMLNQYHEDILKLRNKFIKEAHTFVTRKPGMMSPDFFHADVANRAIALLEGFVTLAEKENYLSAIPLIRLQLDNLIGIFACTRVSDFNKFYMDYLDGIHIRNMKDSRGNLMRETYLVDQIESSLGRKMIIRKDLNTKALKICTKKLADMFI